jgi:hypothetical protein
VDQVAHRVHLEEWAHLEQVERQEALDLQEVQVQAVHRVHLEERAHLEQVEHLAVQEHLEQVEYLEINTQQHHLHILI